MNYGGQWLFPFFIFSANPIATTLSKFVSNVSTFIAYKSDWVGGPSTLIILAS
jgi:hypothetical protein